MQNVDEISFDGFTESLCKSEKNVYQNPLQTRVWKLHRQPWQNRPGYDAHCERFLIKTPLYSANNLITILFISWKPFPDPARFKVKRCNKEEAIASVLSIFTKENHVRLVIIYFTSQHPSLINVFLFN